MKQYTLQSDHGPIKTHIDYQKELNKEQLDVVTTADGPALVLAGAGSGKTRTLVYRVAYLLERGVPADRILLMTFTNKAAFEMLSRVESLLKTKPKGLWGGTFHSLANRVLRVHAEKLGYTKTFIILDEDDAKSMLKSCLAQINASVKDDKYFPKVNVLKNIISYAVNSAQNIKEICAVRYDYLSHDAVDLIENLAKIYIAKKRAANVMDFDDLLLNWFELLNKHPEVCSKYANQFQYILVDEYQDTNKIQGYIIDLLAQKHRNILVVGDDSQSIYSFRAATIANILEFPQRYEHCKTFRLENNYRSTPEILELANQSIRNNTQQFEKSLKSQRKSSERPALVAARDAYQQADFVCQRLLELRDEGLDLSEIAVLFRSSFQMIELELELNKRNIPYLVRGGTRFFEQAHIKDVICYLKVMANVRDELSWIRILNQWDGIGLSTSKKIIDQLLPYDSLENLLLVQPAIKVSSRAKKSLDRVFSIFLHIIDTDSRDFIASSIKFILANGYEERLKQNFENFRERLEDLEQLANFSANYKTLEHFLSDVALSEGFRGKDVASGNDADEHLVLTTIHQAKGLEWRSVFVIGLAEGHFPHHKVYAESREMEEERRLFYVACTRAKEYLYLIYPIFTNSYMTGDSICRPSTFLTEVDEKCFEKWELDSSFFDDPSERTVQYDE